MIKKIISMGLATLTTVGVIMSTAISAEARTDRVTLQVVLPQA